MAKLPVSQLKVTKSKSMGTVSSSEVQGHEVVWEATESENTVVPCTMTQGRQVQGVYVL